MSYNNTAAWDRITSDARYLSNAYAVSSSVSSSFAQSASFAQTAVVALNTGTTLVTASTYSITASVSVNSQTASALVPINNYTINSLTASTANVSGLDINSLGQLSVQSNGTFPNNTFFSAQFGNAVAIEGGSAGFQIADRVNSAHKWQHYALSDFFRIWNSSGKEYFVMDYATGRTGFNLSTASVVNQLDVGGNISCSVITASLFNGTASWANSASYVPNQSTDTILLTGSTTTDFQNALNKGGVIWIQKGNYTVSNLQISKSVTIYGNNATLNFSASATGFMLDTGPINDIGGKLTIENLVLNGGNNVNFNNVTYFSTLNGSVDPYYNPNWVNRSGLRVDCLNGGVIRNCLFTGFSGNGVLLTNQSGSLAQQYPRLEFIGNTLYQNFIGVFSVGANYDAQGYYNNPSGQWVTAQSEYTQIVGNICSQNQFGIIATAGNNLVSDNTSNDNYIGLYVGTGNNAAHGSYINNNLNHNVYALWGESNNGGIYANNVMIASNYIKFVNVQSIQFQNNWVGGSPMTMSAANSSSGIFKNNWYIGTWGTDFLLSVVSASTLTYTGNHSTSVLGDSDNTSISLIENSFTGSIPITASNSISASFAYTASYITASKVVGTVASASWSRNNLSSSYLSGSTGIVLIGAPWYNTSSTDYNTVDVSSDGTGYFQFGRNDQSGTEAIMIISDAFTHKYSSRGSSFFQISLDAATTTFDIDSKGANAPTEITFVGYVAPVLYLNEVVDGSGTHDVNIKVDGGAGINADPTNRKGRSLIISAEPNVGNAGDGGNVVLVGGLASDMSHNDGKVILSGSVSATGFVGIGIPNPKSTLDINGNIGNSVGLFESQIDVGNAILLNDNFDTTLDWNSKILASGSWSGSISNALTASIALNSITSAFATNAVNATNAQTAAFANALTFTPALATTASFAVTASFAQTASYITSSKIVGTVTSASFAITASRAVTSSFAINSATSSISSHAATADSATSLNTAHGSIIDNPVGLAVFGSCIFNDGIYDPVSGVTAINVNDDHDLNDQFGNLKVNFGSTPELHGDWTMVGGSISNAKTASFISSSGTVTIQSGNNTVELFNTNSAQRLNIYNAYNDSSNFKRLSFYGSSGDYFIDANGTGSGTSGGDFYIKHSAGSHSIRLWTSNTERYRIENNGDFVPARDNVYSLGSSGLRFANVYAGNFSGSLYGTASIAQAVVPVTWSAISAASAVTWSATPNVYQDRRTFVITGATTMSIQQLYNGWEGSLKIVNGNTGSLLFISPIPKVISGATGSVMLTNISNSIDMIGLQYDGTTLYAAVGNNFN